MGCCSGLLLLGMGSGCTPQEPTGSAPQKPARKAQPVLASPPALPARQEVRVNDTLVLICSHPYTTLPQYETPTLVMWSHLALRGRRGYYEVLSSSDSASLYCLFQCQDEALVSAQGDVLHVSALEPDRLPGDDARRGQPLPHNAVYALDRLVWDVRYRHYTGYLTADLKEWNWRAAPCFTGGFVGEEEYCLLPHWISQEQAYLKRRHHLPPAHRLLAYSACCRELAALAASAYRQSYGPLLLQLLHAWRTYPLPATSAEACEPCELRYTKRRSQHTR